MSDAKKPTKYNRLRNMRIDEISAVDSPAQKAARVVMMKRDGAPADAPVIKAGVLLSDTEGHSHLLDNTLQSGETSWSKSEGDEYGHSHPFVMDSEGNFQIGASSGHTHTVVAKRDINPEKTQMTPEQIAKLQADAAAAQTALAKAQEDLAKANALATLNDSARAHYAKLDAAGQDAFLKLDATARAAAVEAVTKADSDANAVVYTSVTGEVFRKNDDPRLIAYAKRADESARTAAIEKANADQARFEKRATDELANLGGELPAKVALLKAIEGITDAALRTQAGEVLKAASSGLAAALAKAGTTGGVQLPAGAASATQQLDALAKRHATDNKCTAEAAYAAVLQTPEGQRLYAETVAR